MFRNHCSQRAVNNPIYQTYADIASSTREALLDAHAARRHSAAAISMCNNTHTHRLQACTCALYQEAPSDVAVQHGERDGVRHVFIFTLRARAGVRTRTRTANVCGVCWRHGIAQHTSTGNGRLSARRKERYSCCRMPVLLQAHQHQHALFIVDRDEFVG